MAGAAVEGGGPALDRLGVLRHVEAAEERDLGEEGGAHEERQQPPPAPPPACRRLRVGGALHRWPPRRRRRGSGGEIVGGDREGSRWTTWCGQGRRVWDEPGQPTTPTPAAARIWFCSAARSAPLTRTGAGEKQAGCVGAHMSEKWSGHLAFGPLLESRPGGNWTADSILSRAVTVGPKAVLVSSGLDGILGFK